ncbi:diguanylate cyclase domain-containing protein [Klebsiella variicola]|uniref:diguanylate cyclase domain-containing protein n=1 Tax=Klebsiella variicola TaxID=244366 RepID=UPI000D74600B|nr:diguanylate cyclase [Klebsiella variicola]PXK73550.1 oxygen-sensing cyclic-di-GMP phosphodiesterase [Klebsiella variicola]
MSYFESQVGLLIASVSDEQTSAIVIMNDLGRILLINPAAECLLRLNNCLYVGAYAMDVLPSLYAKVQTPTASEEPVLLRNDNDGEVWVTLEYTPLEVADNELWQMTIQDVTHDVLLRRQAYIKELLLSHSAQPIALLDAQRRIARVSHPLSALCGYAPEEMIGRNLISFLLTPALTPRQLPRLESIQLGQDQDDMEIPFRPRSGKDIWIRTTTVLLPNSLDAGIVGYSFIRLTDITEDKVVQSFKDDTLNALMSGLSFESFGAYLCQRISEIFPELYPSLMRIDCQLTLRSWAVSSLPDAYNQHIDGLAPREGMISCGTAVARKIPVRTSNISEDPLWQDFKHVALSFNLHACWSYPILQRDGNIGGTFALYSTVPGQPTAFHERIVQACIMLCALAIDYENSRQKLAHHALIDPLTDLPNRLSLEQYTDQLLKSSGTLALTCLCIDLDNFKDINSILGHIAGDQFLRIIATRLQTHLDPTEFLARGTGDRFIIVAEGDNEKQMADKAKRLQNIIGETIIYENRAFHLSASIGICFFSDNYLDRSSWFSNTSAAVQRAKMLGGDTYQFFHPSMNQNASDRIILGAALKNALTSNELYLVYQPQVDARDGSLYGVEALARWNSPLLGVVPPAKFITVAEEIGQIQAISRWVLREACRQLSFWLSFDLPIRTVSVNLSPDIFRDSTIEKYVVDLLKEFCLAPSRLTLEITECSSITLNEDILGCITRLHSLGVGISIDDFGTGFSSLSRLITLPVNELKIDRLFVDKAENDRRIQAVIAAIIGLGRNMGLTIIAEGVESAAQHDMLAKLGCNVLQGYHISRPVPPDAIPDWIINNNLHSKEKMQDIIVSPSSLARDTDKLTTDDPPVLPVLETLQRIFDSLPIGLAWATMPNAQVVHCNSAFDVLFGYEPGYFRTAGQLVEETYIRQEQRTFAREIWREFKLEGISHPTVIPDMKIDILTKEGYIKTIAHYGVILPKERLAVGIFKDISELQRNVERLEEQAYTDPLTGTANRRGLENWWVQEMLRKAPRTLLLAMVDLDNFKIINDTFGHETGDRVLIAVTNRLRRCLCQTDLVSRIGGDEFVVIAECQEDAPKINAIGMRIQEAVQTPVSVGHQEFSITASIGICLFPSQANDLRHLLQEADRSLYNVKHHGKAGWRWQSS